MYTTEWISELSVIPAFACFLAGVLAGMVLTLSIIASAARHDRRREEEKEALRSERRGENERTR